MYLTEAEWDIGYQIYPAQDKVQCQVLVNMLLNLKRSEISYTDEPLLASQQGLCFMKLICIDVELDYVLIVSNS